MHAKTQPVECIGVGSMRIVSAMIAAFGILIPAIDRSQALEGLLLNNRVWKAQQERESR
jgi:hypothetical protein